ncbi:MAG: hypothetical protein N2Z65_05525 [Clostridiales bacterium]|nr:hypothetical protein [Clostridiales bacterium]
MFDELTDIAGGGQTADSEETSAECFQKARQIFDTGTTLLQEIVSQIRCCLLCCDLDTPNQVFQPLPKGGVQA